MHRYFDSQGDKHVECLQRLEMFIKFLASHCGEPQLDGKWRHEFVGPQVGQEGVGENGQKIRICMQTDSVNCGLFVIGNAYAIARGKLYEMQSVFPQASSMSAMDKVRKYVLRTLVGCRC